MSRSKEREEYTWSDAARDLALVTRLDLIAAVTITEPFKEKTTVHPYDALPLLRWLVSSDPAEEPARFASNLKRLMDL